MVIQGWFAVTALILGSKDNSAEKLFPLILSVMGTCVSSVVALCDTVSTFLPWSRKMLTDPERDHALLVPRLFACMCIHVIATLAILFRFIGFWVCKSHDWKLLAARCAQ